MEELRIAEVAERTGIPATALRFYDDAGIVTPQRTPNGYRSYSAADVEALQFVARSKLVGLSLEEIAEALELRNADRCAPLQDRLVELVAARLRDSRAQLEELMAFMDELTELRARLSQHRPEGACDDDCGCLIEDAGAHDAATKQLLITPSDVAGSAGEPGGSCTLDRGAMPARARAWGDALRDAHIERDETGAVIDFAEGIEIAAIAELVRAETLCCAFFAFDLHVDATATTLKVSAPPEQQHTLDRLLDVGESPAVRN